MRQVKDYGDERNKGFCVHCGGPYETDDHMPSKVFLDKPWPENLPSCPACDKCNQKFSPDEEYLACLLECVVCGSTDPEKLERSRIARKLTEAPALRERLRQACSEQEGRLIWNAEVDRVETVVLKLARGHVAFEQNEPKLDEPSLLWFKPMPLMTAEERAAFERDGDEVALWPEVGSRAMGRLFILDDEAFEEGWLLVQEGRYRYRVLQDGGLRVRIVIRDYLAAEVGWE